MLKKIYTRHGDQGKTCLHPSLTQNSTVNKNALRLRAIGSLDEANSLLGVVICFFNEKKFISGLQKIQKEIFEVGSILAGVKFPFGQAKIKKLEKEIDLLAKELPSLKNFILPGGSPAIAFSQTARAVIRRAEREVTSLKETEVVSPWLLVYLNRLSDYLFVLARHLHQKEKVREIVWPSKKSLPRRKAGKKSSNLV